MHVSNIIEKLKAWVGMEKSPVLGIDIGSHSVKIVALKQGASSVEVISAGFMAFPGGAINLHKIVDCAAVANVIRALIKQLGLEGQVKSAVVGLPSRETISKTIYLDMAYLEADEATVELQLISEMTPFISFPVEELRLDYQFLEQEGELIPVLTVATSAQVIANYETIIEQAGLEVICLEPEQYAIARTYGFIDLSAFGNKPNLCLAMLDFGALYASLTVIEGDEVLYADEQKIRLDTQSSSQSIRQLSERALTLFYTSGLRTEVDGLVLMGSNFPDANDLLTRLKESLNLPVTSANPFAHMAEHCPIPGNRQSYLLSAGLALRGLQHDQY